MKANESDLRRFFKSMNIKTRDVILLRDKRTGKHKGFAYVELKHMHDVNRALQASEKVPDFQRFPILIKASEAEKNKVNPTSSQVVAPKKLPPLLDDDGNVVVAQKVYVGNLEVSQVTAQHIQTLFSPFGTLEEVQLQTGKGFAFLQFRDPKEAALAIQSMSGQKLAGRAMKTGWATSNPHALTATDFPPDATARIQNAYAALASLTMGSTSATGVAAAAAVPGTVAEARMSLAVASVPTIVAPPAMMPVLPVAATAAIKKETFIANANNPTNSLIIYNMFDKDQETEPGWPKDIELEFIEECTKYGPIGRCVVAYREVGGKIYATFHSGAQSCASSLAGRWFDKRQLRVEFVESSVVDSKAKEYGM
jgi:RNA-binding protein 23/39